MPLALNLAVLKKFVTAKKKTLNDRINLNLLPTPAGSPPALPFKVKLPPKPFCNTTNTTWYHDSCVTAQG